MFGTLYSQTNLTLSNVATIQKKRSKRFVPSMMTVFLLSMVPQLIYSFIRKQIVQCLRILQTFSACYIFLILTIKLGNQRVFLSHIDVISGIP